MANPMLNSGPMLARGLTQSRASEPTYAALRIALAAGMYQAGQMVFVETIDGTNTNGAGTFQVKYDAGGGFVDDGGVTLTSADGKWAAVRDHVGCRLAEWWGVLPSNSPAANATALQAAITACEGEILLLPTGEVQYSTGVSTPANGSTIIRGRGSDANLNHGSVLRFTGSSGPAINITETTGSPGTNKTTLENFALVGDITKTGVVGVRINDAHGTRLRDLAINSFGSHGIYATDAWVTFIERCTVAQNGHSGIHAVGRCNHFVISNCAVNSNSRRNGYGNVYFSGGPGTENLGVSIVGTDFTEAGPTTAVETVTSAWGLVLQHTHGAIVHGCYSEKAVSSLLYADSTSQAIDIRGSYFQDGQVYIAGCKDSVVEANTFTEIATETKLRVLSTGDGYVKVGPNFFNGGAFFQRDSFAGTNRVFFGTAAPTSGSYLRGDIVYHEEPVAGGTVGWICVTAGSPGTWKTFGAIAA